MRAGVAGGQGVVRSVWASAAPCSAPAWLLRRVDGNRPGLGLGGLGQRQRQDPMLQLGANAVLVNPFPQLELPDN